MRYDVTAESFCHASTLENGCNGASRASCHVSSCVPVQGWIIRGHITTLNMSH